jgi:hypothetical protein
MDARSWKKIAGDDPFNFFRLMCYTCREPTFKLTCFCLQVTAHSRLASWEESIQQARTACEAWKKETALATKKMEQAIKEKEQAAAKANQLQKELDGANGGPHLHAIARVSELKGQPLALLKTVEWQLRKDLQEVEKVTV